MATKRKIQQRILITVNLKDKINEIKNNPPPITGFSISRLEYLIHLIISHKQDNHEGSYSVLNMKYMENIVPKAGKYMDFLRREGIIEWKNYSAGRNSRLYRLINVGKTEFRTITDMNLVRRIEENRSKIGKRNSKKYPHLNRYIKMVEIDHESAVNDVEKEYLTTRNQIKHDTTLDASKRKKKLRECEGRRTFCLAEIEKIRCGEIFITVNPTNYRLDSNYTRLPSYLMKQPFH